MITPKEHGGVGNEDSDVFLITAGEASGKLRVFADGITLYHLYTPVAERRRGLATQIIVEAKGFAAERGLPLGLWSGPFGPEAPSIDVLHRFYLKMGFKPVFWGINWPEADPPEDFLETLH